MMMGAGSFFADDTNVLAFLVNAHWNPYCPLFSCTAAELHDAVRLAFGDEHDIQITVH